ncbi:hypothetical protein GCM10009735_37790 [Actinomadura chokoriensis]
MGRHARVAAGEVAPITGQDYSKVPRERLELRHHPPSDPTDPRDPDDPGHQPQSRTGTVLASG